MKKRHVFYLIVIFMLFLFGMTNIPVAVAADLSTLSAIHGAVDAFGIPTGPGMIENTLTGAKTQATLNEDGTINQIGDQLVEATRSYHCIGNCVPNPQVEGDFYNGFKVEGLQKIDAQQNPWISGRGGAYSAPVPAY